MILLQASGTLPPTVEALKAKVLVTLQTVHAIKEFEGAEDLAVFLDEVLDGLVAAGVQRYLTRVLMFSTDPEAVKVVATRMMPGAHLDVMQPPGCWFDLGASMDRLLMWARRADPTLVFPEQQLKG